MLSFPIETTQREVLDITDRMMEESGQELDVLAEDVRVHGLEQSKARGFDA